MTMRIVRRVEQAAAAAVVGRQLLQQFVHSSSNYRAFYQQPPAVGSRPPWPPPPGNSILHADIGFGFQLQTRNSSSPAGNRRNDEQQQLREEEIMAFKPGVPVEEAVTPPSSWYTDPKIFNLELERVFERSGRWLTVGRVEQLQSPGDYFTGQVGRVRYVVCMDEQRTIRAFHNVCRHHAAAVASGSGCASSLTFVCPYHGWTYGLDGKLRKALRLRGIRNFSARDYGLVPLQVSTWGPFVLISSLPTPAVDSEIASTEREFLERISGREYIVEKEWLGSAATAKVLTHAKMDDSSLRHVTTREYTLNCNWKVFCDNYLDGGYHVPYAHADLGSRLNLKSYEITLHEKVSIQSCKGAEANSESITTGGAGKRVGSMATYAFVYPNFMINRYGPWMDTNLVLPVTATQCRVVIDYFLESSAAHDEAFIKESLKSSDKVQQEDISLCEAVQNGLQSPAYDVGRYAPSVEHAMLHFHTLLHEDLTSGHTEFSSGTLTLDDVPEALARQ